MLIRTNDRLKSTYLYASIAVVGGDDAILGEHKVDGVTRLPPG